jgi:prepilin-type processing-associated H-X9-DG protein
MWLIQEWGRTNKGWICPDAREEKPYLWKSTAYKDPDGSKYPGEASVAWTVSSKYALFGFNSTQPDRKSGSYISNGWIDGIWWGQQSDFLPQFAFGDQSDAEKPTETPVLGDGVGQTVLGTDWGPRCPLASDLPPTDLVMDMGGLGYMSNFCVPRHGSAPTRAPSNFDIRQKLPGAINMSFADGHVQLVKLENLWQLSWHKGYVPPVRRPGT